MFTSQKLAQSWEEKVLEKRQKPRSAAENGRREIEDRFCESHIARN
jgi:hypothetical protein